MEVLKAEDPIIYDYLVKNNYEARYIDDELYVFGDFGEWTDRVPFEFFAQITCATLRNPNQFPLEEDGLHTD